MLKTVFAALVAAIVLAAAPASAGPVRHHRPVVAGKVLHGKYVYEHHVYKHRYASKVKRHKHGKFVKLIHPHQAHRGALVIR